MAVISYINSCLEKQNTDNSLIRHFVTEVSEVPPDLLLKTANVFHCCMLISIQITCYSDATKKFTKNQNAILSREYYEKKTNK